jgi:exodeoxyribonuclease V alpha subunit
MSEEQTLFAATLRGELTRIVYENPEGTYAVVRLLDADQVEQTVVGPVTGVGPGQYLELVGRWEKHQEFGRQFRAESYRAVLPSTADGIIRFLGSGAIPGVGPKTAKVIVDHFGAETLKILDKYPKRLREVPGIGRKKAGMIVDAWQESSARRDVFIYLQGLGITQTYCMKLYKRYGEQAAEVVKNNPYRLAEEIDGIGFLKADEIAAEIGIAKDSIERMSAAAIHAMNQLTGQGHVGCPEPDFVRIVAELAAQPEELAAAGIDRAIARRLLCRQDGLVYAPQLARAEKELPLLVRSLAEARDFAGRRCIEPAGPARLKLNAEQKLAVERVTAAALGIITGGPGVGKTTVVGEIVRRAKAAKLRIAAAAPTGRAAKRLSETTGVGAKTLHRLLAYDPATGKFGYDHDTQLPCDLLIVDEVSMLDILLALALFRAIAPGTSVILVGDRDQLPSVGPGTVLASFIHSGWFGVTSLTQVFRQAEGSRIIVNAHRVNRGLMPEKPAANQEELTDFYWVEQDDPEKTLALIVRMAAERIPARFGLDPVRDVQVLTPMNRGSCGTAAINQELQRALNGGDKPQFKFGDRTYKSGDKVMQTSNNYDKLVFNGDLGKIAEIHSGRRKFQVLFDDSRLVEYGFDEADQLMMAYAITVHKSQGSEFPAVILPMLSQHYMMLQRNLLYTAMTRARRLLLLIGSRKAIEMAVRNTRLEPRYTLLTERMIKLREEDQLPAK